MQLGCLKNVVDYLRCFLFFCICDVFFKVNNLVQFNRTVKIIFFFFIFSNLFSLRFIMILNEISEFIIVDDLNNEFSNVRKKN